MSAVLHLELTTPEGKAVELFLARPGEEATPKGAILFVHGHQHDPAIGGRGVAENGMLTKFAQRRSVIAASISQPGYGQSDGPADFCGPATQRAITLVLDHLEETYGLIRPSMVLYGVSRGAIAAAMVATREPDLGGLILIAGVYDLAEAYQVTIPGIRANIEREAGLDVQAFSERSALYHADAIRAQTYILHGRSDERAPVVQAERLHESLACHANAQLFLFDCGHQVPFDLRRSAVRPLYDTVFGQEPTS